MREKEFDQYIREQLGEYPSAVPDDMWQRIQGKKDDRKASFFWWWVGGAFIGGCLILFYFLRTAAPARVTVPAPVAMDRAGSGRSRGGEVGGDSGVVVGAGVGGDSGALRRSGVAEGAGVVAGAGVAVDSRFATRSGAGVAGHSNVAVDSGIAGDPDVAVRSGAAVLSGVVKHARAMVRSRVAVDLGIVARSRLSPKAPPLPTPNSRQKKDSVIVKGVSLDLSLSPLIPHTPSRDGLSYAAGLRVSIPIRKRFSFISGFQYTMIRLKQYKDSGTAHSASRITNLDLPVLISYTAEMKQFRLGVNTGLIANLHSWPGGASASYNMSYLKNTGLSLYLGLDLEKKLGSRWSLFVEPYYKYQLTKRADVPDVQQGDAPGSFFGVRYNFKKDRQRK